MLTKPNGRYSPKAMTAALRELACEAITIENDGTPVTREQLLAKLIWNQALGWIEEIEDENGNTKKIVHKPVAWAQQYLFERLEGKAPISLPDVGAGIKAADKVRQLAKERVNAMATAKAGGPPKFKPKKSDQ